MFNRLVEAYEQRQIANNATRKNRLKLGDTDINESVQAEQNLLDVQQLLVTLSREKQPLIHCAVFLELKAKSMSALESLQSDISMELTRSKITADRLTLRQKEGFLSTIESKVFGIGVEAYTVGSAEFALSYAAMNKDKCIPLMDNGHYHPTEVVSDKIPALLAFFPEIALHITRPIRWDSDHVVLLDDETKEIRCGGLDGSVDIALD